MGFMVLKLPLFPCHNSIYKQEDVTPASWVSAHSGSLSQMVIPYLYNHIPFCLTRYTIAHPFLGRHVRGNIKRDGGRSSFVPVIYMSDCFVTNIFILAAPCIVFVLETGLEPYIDTRRRYAFEAHLVGSTLIPALGLVGGSTCVGSREQPEAMCHFPLASVVGNCPRRPQNNYWYRCGLPVDGRPCVFGDET